MTEMSYERNGEELPAVREIAALERDVENGVYDIGNDAYNEEVDRIVSTVESQLGEVYGGVTRRFLDPEKDPVDQVMFDAAIADLQLQYEIAENAAEVNN